MILTGKAKEVFDKFLYDKYENVILKEEQEIYWGHYAREVTILDVYEKLPLELQQNIIISWLDSVGIIVYTIPVYHFGGLSFKSIIDGYDLNMEEFYFFKNRLQATEKAIERAVELFNERSER